MKNALTISIISLASCLISCTDTIVVNVERGETQLVVDGEITDQPGPYTVKLTETVYAFGSDSPPAVTGATVLITDNTGRADTLRETSVGVYQTRSLRGKIGAAYTLSIKTGRFGNYTAQTEIRRFTPIDSLYGEYQDIFPGETSGGYLIKYNYTDPPGPGDSFRAKLYRNRNGEPDKLLNEASDLSYVQDKYNDGNRVMDAVVTPKKFSKGERATLVLLSLTADAYEFLKELDTQTNNSGLFANPPANVRTNIINTDATGKKAVGYFFGSAQVSRSWTVQ